MELFIYKRDLKKLITLSCFAFGQQKKACPWQLYNYYHLGEIMWENVAILLKESVAGLDTLQVAELFREQLRIYKLLDENNAWCVPFLEKYEKEIWPDDISSEQLCSFVDAMLQVAKRNSYLEGAAVFLEDFSFDKLREKTNKDGSFVFPRVVVFSYILEEMTKVCIKNRDILEQLDEYWGAVNKQEPEYWANFSIFEKAKMASIQGIGSMLIKSFRFYDPPDYVKNSSIMNFFCVSIFRLNIFEAVVEDFRLGLHDNALCGIAQLLQCGEYRPISIVPNQYHFECTAPEHILWNDLYITWNLAFCSHYSNFPFVMTKLLIPSVNDFHDAPKKYAENRCYALYLYLIFLLYSRDHYLKHSPQCLGWFDPELSSKWGEWNKKCSSSYLSTVAQNSPGLINKLNVKVHNLLLRFKQ